jgi:subtilisin family serine protease
MRCLSWLAAIGAAVLVPATLAAPAVAAPTAQIVNEGTPEAIPGQYVVVLKDSAVARSSVSARARSLATAYGGTVGHVYTAALNGFSIATSAQEAHRLAADPAVAYVQQDSVFTIQDSGAISQAGEQVRPPSWGLDAIDQRTRPGDGVYRYPNTGAGVTAYILDTGVRITHSAFGGRARYGIDAVDNDGVADDCHGHGTHVAGSVSGTYGVAKEARIVSVRVLDCVGTSQSSWIIAGVDWVTANAVRPAVANISFIKRGSDPAVEAAIRRSIGSGITYAIAAGNDNALACDYTPARVHEAVTVAAFDPSYGRSAFTNWGWCVELFAPGELVNSASRLSDTAVEARSGTSMAAPHVAGAAALYLQHNPAAGGIPTLNALVSNSTYGLIQNVSGGTPNLTVYIGFIPPSP